MNPEQEKRLLENSINIGKLNEKMTFVRESNRELHKKIDLLFVQIEKNNAEREADVLSLRAHHDEDIKPMKKNAFIVIGNNKWLSFIYWAVIIFAFWQQINQISVAHCVQHRNSPAPFAGHAAPISYAEQGCRAI